LLTREYNIKFADALSNSHENDHIDLTIEGPFDHVTDRINNAIGIELARSHPNTPCEDLIETAWNNGYLATVKNFRVEDQSPVADVYWQEPLYYLPNTYSVIPDFTQRQTNTVIKMGIIIPNP
jgi:hypothetical protein